ncbi:hypothetical protein TIFTF001_033643 [Ficus carica]|uniref:Uncharacterized protein n=1 Tax=Ficus carica TaxID=3494 RepID=A0AA88E153_FICCA|nr:hypothetical protein TIFTF001_033643 [Ficus carica]
MRNWLGLRIKKLEARLVICGLEFRPRNYSAKLMELLAGLAEDSARPETQAGLEWSGAGSLAENTSLGSQA